MKTNDLKKDKFLDPIKDLSQYLKDHGIKPSFHRIKTLEYLNTHHNHPTVDMIYNKLIKEVPTLSKTTIYNTLTLFLEHGIIMALSIEGTEIKYDLNSHPHLHFKCLKCGRIFDIILNEEISFLDRKSLNGHQVKECQVNYKGICKECIKKR